MSHKQCCMPRWSGPTCSPMKQFLVQPLDSRRMSSSHGTPSWTVHHNNRCAWRWKHHLVDAKNPLQATPSWLQHPKHMVGQLTATVANCKSAQIDGQKPDSHERHCKPSSPLQQCHPSSSPMLLGLSRDQHSAIHEDGRMLLRPWKTGRPSGKGRKSNESAWRPAPLHLLLHHDPAWLVGRYRFCEQQGTFEAHLFALHPW